MRPFECGCWDPQFLIEWFNTGVQTVKEQIGGDCRMSHRQYYFNDTGQSRCPFSMADDGFNTPDLEGTEILSFLIAEKGFANRFCFYRVSSGRSSTMGLEKLRPVGLPINVETSTRIAVAD